MKSPAQPTSLEQRTIEWGVAARTLPGQAESGDMYVVKEFSGGMLVGVVDGLGHGIEAAFAARMAVQTLEQHAGESIIGLLRRVHERLKMTRGVVMSIASFNFKDNSMTWLSVGNVEGVFLRGDPNAKPPREIITLRGGVVGYQLPQVYASMYDISLNDTLIFATDGIRGGFESISNPPAESAQKLAERVCDQFYKGTDDALALVARFVGNPHAA